MNILGWRLTLLSMRALKKCRRWYPVHEWNFCQQTLGLRRSKARRKVRVWAWHLTLSFKTTMKLLETISTWVPLSRWVISDVYTLNIVFGRLNISTFENIFVSILYLFEFELYDISYFRYMKPLYSFFTSNIKLRQWCWIRCEYLGLMWFKLGWFGGGGGKVKFFFKSVKDFKLSLICFIIKENLLIFPFF